MTNEQRMTNVQIPMTVRTQERSADFPVRSNVSKQEMSRWFLSLGTFQSSCGLESPRSALEFAFECPYSFPNAIRRYSRLKICATPDLGYWSLELGHSLVIGHWSLVIPQPPFLP